ncbi:MAG TPA: oligosaccharide flippase family protein [Gemmatimonadales bacterium]|nr:oligosaccharide flippase family protein [Gemmatimonadales bacterium]
MPPSSQLDRTLVHGIAWTSVIRWVTQLASWVITLYVAHLLAPSDYGLVGMALIYFGFAQLVCDAGLTGAIVQTRDLEEPQFAAIGTVGGVVGIALCALTLLSAPYVASFFREGRVSGILMVLSLTFPLRGFQILPRGLLARELQFRTLAFMDGIESATVMTTTLIMAVLGAGYWSLVGGPLVGSVTSTVLCYVWRPHRLAIPRDFPSLRPALRIGWHLLVSNIAWYAYSNADFTVVGRVLGTAALGAYTLAWTIASVPVDRISSLVGRVTPAFFAAVQTDRAGLRRYLSLLTEGLALITLPLCLGLFLTAPDFVTAFLGARWNGVTGPLQLLALYAALRSVTLFAPQVLVSTGRSGRSMVFSVLALVILPPVFYVGTRWGPAGVALGWVTVYPILVVMSFLRYALRAIEMRWSGYLAALIPAGISAAVMTGGVWGARHLAPVSWGVRPVFVVEVVSGALAYLATSWILYRRRIHSLISLLRRVPGSTVPGRPKRLLLISYHFPPDPAVGAVRWGKLVRFAVERGWQMDVVTRDPSQLSHPDAAALAELPAGVHIHHVPDRRGLAERFESALRGFVRHFRRPRRAQTAGEARVPQRAPMVESLGREEMARWPRTARAWVRVHHALMEHAQGDCWARDAEAVARRLMDRHSVTAVITCGPPHTAHRAGQALQRRTGIPWVLDLRDPWSLVQRLPEGIASPAWLFLAARREAQAARFASLIVVNTERHATALRARYPAASCPIIPVLNGCDDEPLPPSRDRERFVIAYTGTIYLDRDPGPLFRGVARAVRELGVRPQDLGIELMGHVASFNGASVHDLAAAAGIPDYVRLSPPAPKNAARELLAGAAVLVVLPQDSDMAIPAKVFEYLRFDAWVLALASPASATGELLSGTIADVVPPGDEAGIARVICDRFQRFQRGERPTRISTHPRFSRHAQAEVLFRSIERVVDVPPEAAAPSPRPPILATSGAAQTP